MDNKSDKNLLIMQATIESNRQYCDYKMKNITEDLTVIIKIMMDHINISKSSPSHKDSPKPQYPTTVVPANNGAPTL